jgi:DNA-binding NarL/FixJ family response regulator
MFIKEPLSIRIVLADDHKMLRDGFRLMLKKFPAFKLVGQAENGAQLMQKVAELLPDIVITDIKMPSMGGIEATKRISKKYPKIAIIAFSAFDEESMVIDMLEAGAKGYLLKNASRKEVFEAITTVHNKGVYYCHTTSLKLARMIGKSNVLVDYIKPKTGFTEREIDIIRLVCGGLPNKEIAATLTLSVRTIEDYRAKVLEKIGINSTAGMIVYAIKNGIYSLDHA